MGVRPEDVRYGSIPVPGELLLGPRVLGIGGPEQFRGHFDNVCIEVHAHRGLALFQYIPKTTATRKAAPITADLVTD